MSGVESRGMPEQKPHAGGKDFSKGKIWSNIMVQAVPLILAQLVQLLYNVVDTWKHFFNAFCKFIYNFYPVLCIQKTCAVSFWRE